MSPDLLTSLKQHEGLRLKAYQDSNGIWTAGYGRNLQQMEITRETADVWLIEDVKKAIKELDRAAQGWRNHSETRQNVLIELCFNLGMPRLLGFVKFWNALRNQSYAVAAQELLQSKWAKQVGQRAITLAARMETDSF